MERSISRSWAKGLRADIRQSSSNKKEETAEEQSQLWPGCWLATRICNRLGRAKIPDSFGWGRMSSLCILAPIRPYTQRILLEYGTWNFWQEKRIGWAWLSGFQVCFVSMFCIFGVWVWTASDPSFLMQATITTKTSPGKLRRRSWRIRLQKRFGRFFFWKFPIWSAKKPFSGKLMTKNWDELVQLVPALVSCFFVTIYQGLGSLHGWTCLPWCGCILPNGLGPVA